MMNTDIAFEALVDSGATSKAIVAQVTVSNTGGASGGVIILSYIRPVGTTTVIRRNDLPAFDLAPGATVTKQVQGSILATDAPGTYELAVQVIDQTINKVILDKASGAAGVTVSVTTGPQITATVTFSVV